MSASEGALKHHFEDIEQQRGAERLGMWMFLATEILFFGGIFLAYTVYRLLYAKDFADISGRLNVAVAGINTILLLTSSLTIMLSIRAAQLGNRSSLLFNLGVTALLGAGFMCFKAYEYAQDYEEGLVPWCHNFGQEKAHDSSSSGGEKTLDGSLGAERRGAATRAFVHDVLFRHDRNPRAAHHCRHWLHGLSLGACLSGLGDARPVRRRRSDEPLLALGRRDLVVLDAASVFGWAASRAAFLRFFPSGLRGGAGETFGMAYFFDHDRVKEDNPAAHTDNVPTIVTIYLILVIGAIATIALSFAGLGDAAIYVHMAISTAQVCLVGYFWMHLQRSDSETWLVALSAFFIMILLFALPLTDFLTRRYGGL